MCLGAHEVVGEREAEEAAEVGGDDVEEQPEAVGEEAGEVAVAVRPSIDQMIEELQRQQDQRLIAIGEAPINSPPSAQQAAGPPPMGSPRPVSRSNSGE